MFPGPIFTNVTKCEIMIIERFKIRVIFCHNNDKKRCFTSTDHRGYKLRSCQNVCDALSYLLDNIYIRFGNKFYKLIVGFPTGTNCAPLVADLFSFFYERDCMTSLSDDNQTDGF